MGKYDFIKTGNLLYWHDPDNGLSDGAYRVISAPENMEDDSIILISSGTSESLCYRTGCQGNSYQPTELIAVV